VLRGTDCCFGEAVYLFHEAMNGTLVFEGFTHRIPREISADAPGFFRSICPPSLALRGSNLAGLMDERDELSGHKDIRKGYRPSARSLVYCFLQSPARRGHREEGIESRVSPALYIAANVP
jgi:hypothetical protein